MNRTLSFLLILSSVFAILESTATYYEDKDLETLSQDILLQDFKTTPDPVLNLVIFINSSVFSETDLVLFFCHVAPKFFKYRQELDRMADFANLVVNIIHDSQNVPESLPLLQIIALESKHRLPTYDSVVHLMFNMLGEDHKQVFLDFAIENASLDKFWIPKHTMINDPKRFCDFLLKYFKVLGRCFQEFMSSTPKGALNFDASPVIAGLNLLDHLERYVDLEYYIFVFFVSVPLRDFESKTRSQFLKLMASWIRTFNPGFERVCSTYMEHYDLALLEEADYDTYSIIARQNPSFPRNAAVNEIISGHQKQIDIIFGLLRSVMFDPEQPTTKSLVEADRRMRILCNWEKGLDWLTADEINIMFKELIEPLLDNCNRSFGKLKDIYVDRIVFYALTFTIRIHSIETYPLDSAFSMMDVLEQVASHSAANLYESNALMIVPKTLAVIIQKDSKDPMTSLQFSNVLLMTERFAPQMILQVAQYFLVRPDLPQLFATRILELLDASGNFNTSIILQSIMNRFQLLLNGIDPVVNNALIVEMFLFGGLKEAFSPTEREFILFVGSTCMIPEVYSCLV